MYVTLIRVTAISVEEVLKWRNLLRTAGFAVVFGFVFILKKMELEECLRKGPRTHFYLGLLRRTLLEMF